MKLNFGWRVFLILLPLGVCPPVFGQAYPQLACASVSASKSKCGYIGLSGFSPPHYYLNAQVKRVCFSHAEDNPREAWVQWTGDYIVDPSNCSVELEAALNPSVENCFNDPCVPWAPNDFVAGNRCSVDCQHDPSVGPVTIDDYTYLTPQASDTDWTALNAPGDSPFYCEIHLSEEYTTDMLKQNTINALPPYPGTFTGACSAYRNLYSNETSYAIQRFKYKFTFSPATEPFVIHWVERFTPAGNGSPSDTSRCERISIGTTESSVHEVLEPSSNGTITIEDVYVETFDANTATVASSATPAPAHQLQPCWYGATYPENVDVTIRACSDGTNWHAILTGLNGNYSLQKRLLPNPSPYPPQQDVTGIGGNTTPQNFCAQVTELNDLGYCPGDWYMLQAVVAHEHVHELHLLPALKTVASQIETEVLGVSVPDSGQLEQEAIAEIEASPNFAAAKGHGLTLWNDQYNLLWPPDHTPGGPCDVEEHKVVDPMVSWICGYANSNNWGACYRLSAGRINEQFIYELCERVSESGRWQCHQPKRERVE